MLSIIHAEVRYERDQGLYLHSGGVLPLGRVRAAGQPILRRGADPRRVPVRALMGDPGKCGKAVRPALSGTAPRSRQDKHLTDTPLHFSIRKKGSAGGHNGIKNIIAQLGTQNFQRVKVGVGEKPKGWDLADYVLGHFSKEDRGLVDDALKRVAGAVELMVQGEVDQAMNQFN